MEALSDTFWDVVICGTGLKQSLLALSLSRSDKQILHIDPNDYYGGSETAFSLAEAEEWATSVSGDLPSVFRNASITKPADDAAASDSRKYSLALAPQIVYSRSSLISHLVSSRAYRQVEFLAVGSFFVLKARDNTAPTLTRIPSTREDVFSTTDIPTRAKRSLMKFLKFVLEHNAAYDSEANRPVETQPDPATEWSDKPLAEFLRAEFKLDPDLQAYILALTLDLDWAVSTKHGLAAIHRHLDSMGVFGPGFAAVYPKWGGLSEVAQVGCRAGAVGGGVYMLGTGIQEYIEIPGDGEDTRVEVTLTNGERVKTKRLVLEGDSVADGNPQSIRRLVALVPSPLTALFTTTADGTPKPAVAVVAFPPRSLGTPELQYPVYAFAHSSDTGECPAGQSVVYLTRRNSSAHDSQPDLKTSLAELLKACQVDTAVEDLWHMEYDQAWGDNHLTDPTNGPIITGFPMPPNLALDDGTLDLVRSVWKSIIEPTGGDDGFMELSDREHADDSDDEVYFND